MNQIHFTKNERIQALSRCGYTEPDARFLDLVAFHSGYFLRRQAAKFLDQNGGQNVTTLIERIFDKGHATAIAYDKDTHLYHLCARSFYTAIGQSDNRNRRVRECSTIKQKLMSLDFVLAHRDQRFLATEQEKLEHFTLTLGIADSLLPARVYGADSQAPVKRFFTEKYPIFLPSNSSLAGPTSFCFVDEGLTTPSHFETFLTHYGGLLSILPTFHLVYVAARPTALLWAEKVFLKHVSKWLVRQRKAIVAEPVIGRLLNHFELRCQYESKTFGGLDRDKLIQLRNGQTEFSKPEHDHLYEVWKSGGDIALRQVLTPEAASRRAAGTAFSTYLLDHDYDFLGTITSR